MSLLGKWQKLFSAPVSQCWAAVSAGQQVPISAFALTQESLVSIVFFSQFAATMKL